jgi:hypothetical protein
VANTDADSRTHTTSDPGVTGDQGRGEQDMDSPGSECRDFVESSGPPPPRELGALLVSAGVIGLVLPGPGIPALMAGGLMLWPKRFSAAEGWLQRRFPETHRKGRGQLQRFLDDLERRYPGSTGVPPAASRPG